MLKKIDQAALFLNKNVHLFQCPLCHTAFSFIDKHLTCENRHQFDLSKKGTLYFLKKQFQSPYTKEMLEPRGRIIHSGMYEPVLQAIRNQIQPTDTLLDVGCGEGSYLDLLASYGHNGIQLGFDISKDGISLATNYSQMKNSFLFCADLTKLPLVDESIDVVLNIFSPSQYNEFKRVLKTNGKIIKVVPESGYLKELREAYYPNDEKQEYSNDRVLQHLEKEISIEKKEKITYTFEIPENLQKDLLLMSPLEWGVDEKVKQQLLQNPISSITVDVAFIVGKV